MADPTYESEINQSAAKPGQESAVNRSSAKHSVPSEGDDHSYRAQMTHGTGVVQDDERDSSGNRQGARRSVSPPTQSAFGPASASDPAPKPAAAAPPSAGGPAGQSQATSSGDPLSISGKTRTAQNLQTVDDISK